MHLYNENPDDVDSYIRKQMGTTIERLKKHISKKTPSVKQAVEDATVILRDLTNKLGYADCFYTVWQQAILSKQPRMMEIALIDIKEFFSREYIDGDTIIEDKRLVILLTELVLSCKDEKEETIQILMINALRVLLKSEIYHVNGEPLISTLSLLINLYSVSKVSPVVQASKDACGSIIKSTFQKLELFGTLTEEESKRAKLTEPHQSQAALYVEQFMRRTVTNLVDEVCIYLDRLSVAQDNTSIPFRLVPPMSETNSPKYKNPPAIELTNEMGHKAGKFGWCIISRSPAASFCKDTRVPVCNKEFKFQYLEEMITSQFRIKQLQNADLYVQDARDVLDMLSQLSQRDPNNPQLVPLSIKCKSLSLQLIYETFKDGGLILTSKKVFEQIIKDSLIQSLLKNSLQQEKQIFVLTLNIFVKLVEHYRDRLKVELEQIIENVYFRILDSSHSSFDQKHLTLTVFQHIVGKPKTLLELFVNYDCHVDCTNLVERILETQCKIIQGKYNKEYVISLNPSQDVQLRSLSLENMVCCVSQLKKYCEEAENVPEEESPSKEVDQSVVEVDIHMEKLDELQKQRQMKSEIQKAVIKFNQKPENGIKHLLAIGYLKDRIAKDVAKFFMDFGQQISKDIMGEYFGSDKEFNRQVLTAYIDSMDFVGYSLDDGLRILLDYFTLPVESQQIDRIMQAFASKYFEDNPGSFNSATAAYTLSYLLMMLQTSLHNPQVPEKDKMKISDVVNLARGINDGEDLPQEAIQSFYSRIQKQPLALHAKEQIKRNLEQVMQSRGDLKKKHDLFVKEAEKGLKRIKKDIGNQDYLYVSTVEYVRPFMEILWTPLLAAFSVVLERYDDRQTIQECFNGIQLCVKLLGKFDLDQEKDTFIIFLQKFCPLNNMNNLSNKQILAVQTFLELAANAGNYLRKSWRNVLQIVSRLDQLHAVVKRVKQDADFFFGEQKLQRETFNHDEQQQIERLFSQIDVQLIDKVFLMSVQLDANTILDFIEALCDLSRKEIQEQQRIFLLSKVVEVADSNMERIKIIWAKIWDIVKAHFWEIGTGKNADLAVYAIDQLKQLSCKFMQQPELANYRFQSEFLQPFEQIFQHNLQTASYKVPIREYILSCMSMLSNMCWQNLKSGWKIIMSIVCSALQDDNPSLVRLCVQITDKIMTVNIEVLSEVHMELIQSLIKLTKNGDLPIVLKAIDHLHSLIEQISLNSQKKEYKRILDAIWIPVLSSLSTLYSDQRVDVQTMSVKTLFTLLKNHSGQQTPEFWKMILRGVIRPLFDEIQYSFQMSSMSRSNSISNHAQQQTDQNKLKQVKASVSQATETLSQFTQYLESQFAQLQPCFADLLDVYIQLVIQNQDVISSVCLQQLIKLITSVGDSLTKEDWDILLTQVSHLLSSCCPNQLFELKDIDQDFQKPLDQILQSEDVMFVIIKLIAQKKFGFKLNITENLFKSDVMKSCIQIILICAKQYLNKLSEPMIAEINKLLRDAYSKCLDFNERLYMRYFLWIICGYQAQEPNPPGFHEIEKMSVSGIISVFYHRQANEKDELQQKELFKEFLDFCQMVVNRCVQAQESFVNGKQNSKIDVESEPSPSTLKQQLQGIQHEDSLETMLAYMSVIKDSVVPLIKNSGYEQVYPHLKLVSGWLVKLCKISIGNPNIGTKCAYYKEYNEAVFNLLEEYLNNTLEKTQE